jgi:hypothetical protein
VDAGERWYPTRAEETALFTPQQQTRVLESSLEGAIRTYLYDAGQKVPHGQDNGSLVNELTMQHLLERVGYTIDKQTDALVKKAGALMHMLGWTVRRLSADEQGRRPRVYVRPPNQASAAGTTPAGRNPDTEPEDPNAPPF